MTKLIIVLVILFKLFSILPTTISFKKIYPNHIQIQTKPEQDNALSAINHLIGWESSLAMAGSLLYAFFNQIGVINVVIATMMITVV
jgi:hypothetical protein